MQTHEPSPESSPKLPFGLVSVDFLTPVGLARDFDATCERLGIERDRAFQELMAAFVTKLNRKLAYLFP